MESESAKSEQSRTMSWLKKENNNKKRPTLTIRRLSWRAEPSEEEVWRRNSNTQRERIHPSINASIQPSIHPSIHPSIDLSIHEFWPPNAHSLVLEAARQIAFADYNISYGARFPAFCGRGWETALFTPCGQSQDHGFNFFCCANSQGKWLHREAILALAHMMSWPSPKKSHCTLLRFQIANSKSQCFLAFKTARTGWRCPNFHK